MSAALPNSSTNPDWWTRTTIYQIYPRSFKDSNGDGIGDLRGIIEQLDYLRDLGVETLWICPFYEGPQRDFGYDIVDHEKVAAEYGTDADLRALVDAVHQRGMKLVFDLVLNHTSDEHPWFTASRVDRAAPLRDFYIWRDGKKPKGAAPPNNWRSALGSSGWHYDARSAQWYFASFLPFQPDLNYRNPALKQRMLGLVRHWLAAGADGLRLDLFHVLYKDAAFADNPGSLRMVPSTEKLDGFFQSPVHTQHHADTVRFASELRTVVDEFQAPPRFLLGEVFGDSETLRRYCGEDQTGLHFVFLFKSLTTRFSARAFRALIEEYERHFPEPLAPTWVFGNHDRPRLIERLGNQIEKAKLVAALQLTVRGVPVIYNGDELGLPHHDMSRQGALDPVARLYRFVPRWLEPLLRRRGILLNRDSVRSPMPWSGVVHGGFSARAEAVPWLPVHPAGGVLHVEAQLADPTSLLNWYRRLLQLRRERVSLSEGRLELILDNDKHVLGYRRIAKPPAKEITTVLLNFSARGRRVVLPSSLRHGYSSRGRSLRDQIGALTLLPHEAIIGWP